MRRSSRQLGKQASGATGGMGTDLFQVSLRPGGWQAGGKARSPREPAPLPTVPAVPDAGRQGAASPSPPLPASLIDRAARRPPGTQGATGLSRGVSEEAAGLRYFPGAHQSVSSRRWRWGCAEASDSPPEPDPQLPPTEKGLLPGPASSRKRPPCSQSGRLSGTPAWSPDCPALDSVNTPFPSRPGAAVPRALLGHSDLGCGGLGSWIL